MTHSYWQSASWEECRLGSKCEAAPEDAKSRRLLANYFIAAE